jgi:lipopolysaccharide/colanic/teichoic acid biosynthesis glycosyltransferase
MSVSRDDSRPTDDPPIRCRASRLYLTTKGAVDRIAACLALLLLSPFLLLLAWRIRRDGHPALFRQTRAGLHGRPFRVLKFRTMRADVDAFGDSPQSGQDPRITPVGRWLRERSFDELPQLINVLRGEMSLVGPRRCRLLVKPGLTGLAQVHGRGSLTIEEKLEWDVQYVERVSLRTDRVILWQTLCGFWRRGDIYEVQYSQTRKRRSGNDTNAGP